MAGASIDTAIRQALVGGASLDSIAILDNFCWSRSNTPESMYELRESARACYETALAYETPFISGKDSMHNDFRGFDKDGNSISISIPPTLLVSAMAVMPNGLDAVSLDFKTAGDYIYVLGETHDEFGGTEFGAMHGSVKAGVPATDAKAWAPLYKKYSRVSKIASSAYAVGRGGLATALAKMAIGGQLGFDVDVSKLPGTWKMSEGALFSESQGRIVATVPAKRKAQFEKVLGKHVVCIGQVTGDDVNIFNKKEKIVGTSVENITKAFEATFKNY
jgi:phosphoribosylformylglycinamidine synthase